MSYIQLPYGYVRNNKQIQFNLPSNYEESFYFDKAPYLKNKNSAVENNLINLIKNRDDLKRWLLATSDYGHEIQENLNAVVGYDEKFNNSIIRHALDLKDEAIFRTPNPINVTFYDMKKFDQVNPVIGKLTAQVKASKLTKQEINQKLLDNFEVDTIQAKLDKLKHGPADDNDNDKGPSGTPDGTPNSPLDDVDDLQRRLDCLRGNIVSPHNTSEQNDKIIHRQNTEKFMKQQLRQREKELANLPKGNVRKKRMSFKLPETPPESPFDDYWDGVANQWVKSASVSGPPEPPLFDYDSDFPPLSRSVQKAHLLPITPKIPLPPLPLNTPRETSFLGAEGSVRHYVTDYQILLLSPLNRI